MATTRLTKETLYLRHDFTDAERLQMGDDLAQAHNRMASIEEEEAVMKAQIKDRKAAVEQTIGTLYRNLNNRFEMRNIGCTIVYDQPNVGEVTYLDPDGKVAKTRPMTESERQMDLPLDEKTDDQAAASVEQSQEAADEFFKPGRPTEQPTAETAAPVVEEPAGLPSAEDLDTVAEEQAAAEATAEAPEGMPWDAAVALLEKSATITAGLLQRNLEISYVQAAHIIDQMIEQKLISRDGSKLKVVKPKKSGPKELAAEHAKQLEEGW